MAHVDQESHGLLLSLAEELVERSPLAAMEFLKTAPMALERIPIETIAEWHAEGSALLDQSTDGGEAYFRMESSRGEDMLEALSSRVELSRISDILRMYSKALTGAEVAVHSSEALAKKGIGWVEGDAPSTEGSAIFLPPHVEEFPDKAQNFSVYKVYCTHQAGHLEFGTFKFEFERDGAIFPTERIKAEADRPPPEPAPPIDTDGHVDAPGEVTPPPGPLTDMERFFDIFADRKLASDLFAIVEDARIDVLISREYGGIRQPYSERQARELDRRPEANQLPVRQAFVENLVRASLGGIDRIVWPQQLMGIMAAATGLLGTSQPPPALVGASAEAPPPLSRLAAGLPQLRPGTPPRRPRRGPVAGAHLDGERQGWVRPPLGVERGDDEGRPRRRARGLSREGAVEVVGELVA